MLKSRSQAEIGAACVFVFVFCSAFRDVYLGGVFQAVSVFLVLLLAFGIATVAGLSIAFRKGGTAMAPLRAAPMDVLMMNLTTAGAWISYFFALKLLDPSIVNTLFAGIGPFVVIALGWTRFGIATRSRSTALQRALQLGVVGTLAVLVWIVATGRSGFQSADNMAALGSAALALLAGSLITVSHLFAKRLDEGGATPSAILGTRFFGLLVVASCGVVYEGPAITFDLSAVEVLRVAGAAFLLIVVPVWFNQIGMSKINPLNARVITAFGPVMVFALQQVDARIAWSSETFAAIVTYSVLVVLANVSQGKEFRGARACPDATPRTAG